ncbi:hypothetical protein [Candidatus Harpocratesius sp.]
MEILKEDTSGIMLIYPEQIKRLHLFMTTFSYRTRRYYNIPIQKTISIMWKDNEGKLWKLDPFYYMKRKEAYENFNNIRDWFIRNYHIKPTKKVMVKMVLTAISLLTFFIAVYSMVSFILKYTQSQ